MKNKGLIVVAIGVVLLALLSCHHNEVNSKAHEGIVQINSKMESGVEALKKKVGEVADMIDTKNAHLNRLENPDSSMIAKVKNYESVLATHAGLLEKHELLIARHKSYIKGHEKSALSPNEIKAQHEQMKKNYQEFESDSIGIIASIDTLKF